MPRRVLGMILLALVLAGCASGAVSMTDVTSHATLGSKGGVSAVTQVAFTSRIGGNINVRIDSIGGPVDAGLQARENCGAFLDSNPPSYFKDSRYGASTIKFDYYVKPGNYCLALENKNGNPVEVDVLVKLPR